MGICPVSLEGGFYRDRFPSWWLNANGSSLSRHFFRVRGGSYERDTKYKPSFNTERAFQVVEKQKPHLMFSITSDFRAKEDRITAIEVLEILNDMRSAMKRQIFVSSHKIRWLDDSELHMIFPVS